MLEYDFCFKNVQKYSSHPVFGSVETITKTPERGACVLHIITQQQNKPKNKHCYGLLIVLSQSNAVVRSLKVLFWKLCIFIRPSVRPISFVKMPFKKS